MARVKITIIGGGSYGWTKVIVTDLCMQQDLEGEIVLEDIDPDTIKLTEPLCRMISERAGGRFSIRSTTDQTDALSGADYVILTISTGRLATMYHDLEIPRKYGIHQPVGDTVGPGGLSRGLRNIPVVVEIAREMERVCPSAWFFNYTNPMTTLTRSVHKYSSIRCIGLCHELFGVRGGFARVLDCDEDELELVAAGVNHLIWLLKCTYKGRDAFELVREAIESGEHGSGEQDPDLVNKTAMLDNWRVKMALFDVFGAVPSAGDRHVVEFFPYFLTERTNYAKDMGVDMTLIEHRQSGYDSQKEKIEKILAGQEELEVHQSKEAISKLISALANNKKGVVDIVNLPNKGQISNLPLDSVVETMAQIGPTSATPLTVGELPRPIQSICNTHIQNQEMIVEAAMTGDRRLALQALYCDPQIREWDYVPRMLDEMLEANRAYLPRFFDQAR